MVPETVHTSAVAEVNDTARLLDEDADTVNVPVPIVLLIKVPKVIVCDKKYVMTILPEFEFAETS